MSNTDSFIEEVTEELRRDQMVRMLRRYGWLFAAAIVLIIGAVAWSEYNKARERAAAQAVGDGLLAVLSESEATARVEGFSEVTAEAPQAQAVVAFLKASDQAEAGDAAAAGETLQALVNDNDLPLIYRQIAQFKALGLTAETAGAETRRAGYMQLAQPGGPLRMAAGQISSG